MLAQPDRAPRLRDYGSAASDGLATGLGGQPREGRDRPTRPAQMDGECPIPRDERVGLMYDRFQRPGIGTGASARQAADGVRGQPQPHRAADQSPQLLPLEVLGSLLGKEG